MPARLGLRRESRNADGEDVLEVFLKKVAVSGWIIETIPLVDHHRSFICPASALDFRDDRFGVATCCDLQNFILIGLGEITQLVDLFVDERQAENINQGVEWTEKPGQSPVH